MKLDIELTLPLDGISGYLWLFMNRGEWFKTKWNGFLAIVKIAIIPMGISIVSLRG
jgi:hypothetical protein